MGQLASIILAAGQGTRMKSKFPKVLHPLLDRPMLQYVVDSARKVGADPNIIVVGFQGDEVIKTIGPTETYVWQKEQLGTGHAVLMAKDILKGLTGELLVLYGDTPLLSVETIQELLELKKQRQAAAAILTTRLEDPKGYGRIIRNGEDNIVGIVEDKDASPQEKQLNEVNTGVYCFEIEPLLQALELIRPVNAQGEYYLTDVFKILVDGGHKVVGLITPAAAEVMGPNDRAQLANTEKYLRQSINEKLMKQGVSLQDPAYTFIGPDVEIGPDTRILPGTFIYGKTKIGSKCVIGPHTRIEDSVIGSGTEIQYSQVLQAQLGTDNTVGPFAYIRPGTVSDDNVKFGDFVEVKNCTIGAGSKVPHLSYLGDAEVGKDVNIGAGTITCNYDGVNKYKTVIHDGAFIGSNSNLVAPVVIGAEATIAAGSTITKEVPGKALGIARSKQLLKLNWLSPRDKQGK